MGKLTSEELRKLLEQIPKSSKTVVPPTIGFDAGVHHLDAQHYLVVSTDPCIGVAEEWYGWLLINYAASDVALFGAKPEFCTIALLGPPSTKAETYLRIMQQGTTRR